MSVHAAGNPTISKLAIAGSVILVIAFAYQFYGWTFLSDTYVLSNDGSSESGSQQLLYRVTKVIDGNTLAININGAEERVRLIGINTPESTGSSGDKGECFSKEVTDRLTDLAEGEDVRLEFDLTQESRDTYDRVLAYVYLKDGQMLNRKMIAEGYAYEYTYLKPYKYQQEFKDLQNIARASSRGLWNENTCNGKR